MSLRSAGPGAADSKLILRFAEFELDLDRRALRRHGEPVHLQPRVIDLLVHLVENRDRIVSKRDLLDALWSDTVVSESALTSAVRDARAALGDRGRVKRYIQTTARRGYRFIAEAVELEDARAESAVLELAPPEELFVGRRHILDRLGTLYERAAAGAGQMVLLVGEPGIGKTACARSFVGSVAEAGGAIHESWCERERGAPPFWPWIQLLRSVLAGAPAEPVSADLTSRLHEVARILPEIRASIEPADPPIPFAPDDARFRLFEAVTELVLHFSRTRPLLLVIDDLQWADGSSLRLLQFAMRRLRASKVMLLTTFRTLAPLRSPELTETLGELLRLPSMERIDLSGLETQEIADWLHAVDGDAEDAGRIRSRTGGNPLFVRQLIRAGALADGASTTPLSGLADFIRSQLNACSEVTRSVLAGAAVLGRALDETLLAGVTGLEPAQLSAGLEEARHGYLLRLGPAPGGYEFANPLIRDVVYEELDRPERARLHARVVAAIRSQPDAAVPDAIAAMSDHLIAAGSPEDGAETIAFAVRAGQRAMEQSAHTEAAHYFDQALEALDREEARQVRRRCWLLLACGEAESAAGFHLARAVARFEAAADLAREHGLVDEFARAALGIGSLAATLDTGNAKLIDLLAEALKLLAEREDVLAVQVRSRLATELYSGSTRERGRELGFEALELARRLDEPLALGSALMAQLIYVGAFEARDECRTGSRELSAVARRCGNPALELWGYHWSLVSALLDARRDDFDRLVRGYRAAAHRHRLRVHMDLVALSEVTHAVFEGDLALAEERLANVRADELAQSTWMSSAHAAFQDFWLRSLRGSAIPVAAVDAYRTQFVPPEFAAAIGCIAALAYAEGGHLARAQQQLDALATADVVSVPHNMFRVLCLATLLRAACLVQDARRCRVLYDALAPYAGSPVNASMVECIGFADHYLGSAALLLGDVDRAVHHFESALEQAERMRTPVFLAETGTELAAALGRRRGRGDRARAFELLSSSVDACARLGLARTGTRVRALLDGLRAA